MDNPGRDRIRGPNFVDLRFPLPTKTPMLTNTPVQAAPSPSNTAAAAAAPVKPPPAWWGHVVFHEDGTRYHRIGPFEIWLTRRSGEWHVAHRCGENAIDDSVIVDVDISAAGGPAVPTSGATELQFALPIEANAVRFWPHLADRAVVFSPLRTLVLPPGGRVTLYATSPLWIEITTAASSRRLLELPLWRPSDTWFGDPTDGELCYSSRLLAVRDASELLRLQHRAVTPLEIANDHHDPLVIERISVPVRSLSLFRDSVGQLWTEPVRMVHESGAALATVTRSGAAPREAFGAERVASPRDALGLRFNARVFFGLFGDEGNQ